MVKHSPRILASEEKATTTTTQDKYLPYNHGIYGETLLDKVAMTRLPLSNRNLS